MGGLTFVLDPHLHHPPREFPEDDGSERDEHEVESKKTRREEEKRRIKLEIDLD